MVFKKGADLPLHPPKASMPITCGQWKMSQNRNRDIIFYVLYGGDTALVRGMILHMIGRLHSITNCDTLSAVHAHAMNNQGAGGSWLKALWILLMNVDMKTKEVIVNPQDRKLVRECFNNDEETARLLSSLTSIDPAKARRFWVDLQEDTIPRWMENEVMTPSDLVSRVKDLYLNS